MSRLVQLAEISPSSFVAGKQLSGKISALKPYNDGTKLATLVLTPLTSSPEPFTIEIELKGKWAKEAMGTFSVGSVVIISSEYAKGVKRKQGPGGKEGKSAHRIGFENGIRGFVAAREEDRTPFHHVNPDAIVESKSSSAQHPRQSSSSTSVSQQRDRQETSAKFSSLSDVTNGPSKKVRPAEGQKRVRENTTSISGREDVALKKQKVEAREMVEETKEAKVLNEAERIAEEKLQKIMMEKKPQGWPAGLSITAVSSVKDGNQKGYYDCNSCALSKGDPFDFVGVVAAFSGPVEYQHTNANNWGCTLNFMDPSAPEDFNLLFGLFRVHKDDLPSAKPGDVVILRKLKYTNPPKKGPTITGYVDRFAFHVFPAALLLDHKSDIPRSLVNDTKKPFRAWYNGADLDYARFLAKWWKEGGAGSRESFGVVRSGGQGSRKTVTIENFEEAVFSNLLVEIIGYFDVPGKPIVEVYATDYTTNDQLFTFTDANEKACGIVGKRLLMIAYWDGAAGDLSKLKKGTLRFLDNVRGKVDPNGTLGGAVSMGYANSGKAWRAPIREPETWHEPMIEELKSRREAYWSSVDQSVPSRQIEDSHNSDSTSFSDAEFDDLIRLQEVPTDSGVECDSPISHRPKGCEEGKEVDSRSPTLESAKFQAKSAHSSTWR